MQNPSRDVLTPPAPLTPYGPPRKLEERFPPICLQEAGLFPFLRNVAVAAVCCCLVLAAPGQQTSKAQLDSSETLFSVLAAMNACGYDPELASSEAVRAAVRNEMGDAVAHSAAAREALRGVCAFYRDHQNPDPNRNLAQFVSLALELGDPPDFPLQVKEADLPPDAAYVLGLVGPLQGFYQAVGLHRIWEQHRSEYDGAIEHFHEPVANLILATDLYLRLPISGYVGRRFVIYLEPLAAPGQVNAQNTAPTTSWCSRRRRGR